MKNKSLASLLAGIALSVPSFEAAAKVEFCGSAVVSDIVLINGATRDVAIWCDGNPSLSLVVGTMAPGWNVTGIGNFNGGAQSDMLLQGPSSQVSYWPGGNPAAGVITGAVNSAAGWSILRSFGDFNADGKDDLVLVNSTTRQVAVWFSADSTTSTILGTFAAGWQPILVADVNGDGQADLILQERATNGRETGRFSYWLGGNPASSGFIGAPGLPWVLAGTGNFVAGAPACDLLWYNVANGGYGTSIGCNSASLTAFSVVGGQGWPEYALQLEDFNGDGVTDIASYHNNVDLVSYFPSGAGGPATYTNLGNYNSASAWFPLQAYAIYYH